MLSIQNVTYTKCYIYEMLPRRNVTIRKCTIRNVTIRNVTDPSSPPPIHPNICIESAYM